MLAACGSKAPPAMPQQPVEVKAVTVEPSSTITYADKVGEVRGSQEVSTQAAGTTSVPFTRPRFSHTSPNAIICRGVISISLPPK